MDTWYYSPYPEPYASHDKLYVCEFTLKYFRKKKTLIRHLAKLEIRHPPGARGVLGPRGGAATGQNMRKAETELGEEGTGRDVAGSGGGQRKGLEMGGWGQRRAAT